MIVPSSNGLVQSLCYRLLNDQVFTRLKWSAQAHAHNKAQQWQGTISDFKLHKLGPVNGQNKQCIYANDVWWGLTAACHIRSLQKQIIYSVNLKAV